MRTLTLILALLLICHLSQAQKKLRGRYETTQTHLASALTLEFKNSNFRYSEDNGMTQRIGTGTYEIRNDSLILTYENPQPDDSSSYTIQFADGNYSATTATITVNVFEEKSKLPFKHAHVTIKDKDSSPVSTLIADSNGKANAILFPNQHMGILDIGAVGYQSAIIPFSKLMRKAATINVYLKPATKVYTPAGAEAYKIVSLTDKRFVLQQGSEKITFVKQ